MSTEGSGNSPTLGVVFAAWAIWLTIWIVGGLVCGALFGVAFSERLAVEPVIRAAAGFAALGMLMSLFLGECPTNGSGGSSSAVRVICQMLVARRERWK